MKAIKFHNFNAVISSFLFQSDIQATQFSLGRGARGGLWQTPKWFIILHSIAYEVMWSCHFIWIWQNSFPGVSNLSMNHGTISNIKIFSCILQSTWVGIIYFYSHDCRLYHVLHYQPTQYNIFICTFSCQWHNCTAFANYKNEQCYKNHVEFLIIPIQDEELSWDLLHFQ